MRFSISREMLLKPLIMAGGVIERKQTLNILSNIHIKLANNTLALTATDLEIQMVVTAAVSDYQKGQITIPGRKFLDICKALPEGETIDFVADNDRAIIRCKRSRFTLSTLPAEEFPNIENIKARVSLTVPQKILKYLIEKTQFAMALQDVRFYLNGLLLEISPKLLRTVATDGHRLAMCEQALDTPAEEIYQVIIPRKGILELNRLLEENDQSLTIDIASNHLRVNSGEMSFTTKLIDGRFPDYQRVLPQGSDKTIVLDNQEFRQALNRASILSNERYRSVRFMLRNDTLKIHANNPEQEEAEEELAIDYRGEPLDIGFNASYVLDALGALDEENVTLNLSDSNSCCLIKGEKNLACQYVVMPMRL